MSRKTDPLDWRKEAGKQGAVLLEVLLDIRHVPYPPGSSISELIAHIRLYDHYKKASYDQCLNGMVKNIKKYKELRIQGPPTNLEAEEQGVKRLRAEVRQNLTRGGSAEEYNPAVSVSREREPLADNADVEEKYDRLVISATGDLGVSMAGEHAISAFAEDDELLSKLESEFDVAYNAAMSKDLEHARLIIAYKASSTIPKPAPNTLAIVHGLEQYLNCMNTPNANEVLKSTTADILTVANHFEKLSVSTQPPSTSNQQPTMVFNGSTYYLNNGRFHDLPSPVEYGGFLPDIKDSKDETSQWRQWATIRQGLVVRQRGTRFQLNMVDYIKNDSGVFKGLVTACPPEQLRDSSGNPWIKEVRIQKKPRVASFPPINNVFNGGGGGHDGGGGGKKRKGAGDGERGQWPRRPGTHGPSGDTSRPGGDYVNPAAIDLVRPSRRST